MKSKKVIKNKLIILGSGPAGCTAAIYSVRANLSPILITGIDIGGQLIGATSIENWPGEINSINGADLMDKMLNHVKKFNINIIYDVIIDTNLKERPFVLIGENNEYICDILIIATGASARYLGLPEEKEYLGKGISSCVVCDGFLYKNKNTAIIGGGNSAIEGALYLSKISKKVYIIHRNKYFKADKILINKIRENIYKNIKIYKDFILKKIIGCNDRVKLITIYNNVSEEFKNLKVDGVFISIGRVPNTLIFKDQLELSNGYLKIGYKISENMNFLSSTSIAGIFAAGDVIYNSCCQAITAAASGCMAALDVEKYLSIMK